MFKTIHAQEDGPVQMESVKRKRKETISGLRGSRRKTNSSPEPRTSSRSSEEPRSRGRVSPGAISSSSTDSKTEQGKPPLKVDPALDLKVVRNLRERTQTDDERTERANHKKLKMPDFIQPLSPSDLDSLDSNSLNEDNSSDPRDIDQDNRSTSPSIASPCGVDSDSDSSVSQCPLGPLSGSPLLASAPASSGLPPQAQASDPAPPHPPPSAPRIP
ncbi:atrophin-1-like, partial [Cetorhinus maximus]